MSSTDPIIGLKRGNIELRDHHPAWKTIFEQEKERILEGIALHIQSIEHVGSTSIIGIKAKPIIDMAITIAQFEDGFNCVSYLESLGYLYKGENGIPGRHYFRTNDEVVKFHIHMMPADHPKVKGQLLFRDYLNAHSKEAKRYEELKIQLSKEFSQDRGRYTESKSSLIEELMEKAKAFFSEA